MQANELPKASLPKAILWDWDNTLIDAWAGVTAALNVVFAAFGRDAWTIEETRARARLSMRESFALSFGAEWPRAAALFQETLAREHLRHIAAMDGAEAALRAGRRWPQGVVSNKEGAFVRREVAHLGWSAYFTIVVGAGDAAADKPDPASIWYALAPIGIERGPHVWYVGDTAVDMLAARAAGCTAVLVGDAAHDGGRDALAAQGAAPDLHFASALAISARLRALARG